jgi:hypothetical protein
MDNKMIFERLFNKDFSDSGNRQLLETISNEHPYFSAAQFYLLQQTAPGTKDFSKQALKTSVLFNNPHWLNFQLLQTNKPPVVKEQSNDKKTIIDPKSETAFAEEDSNDINNVEDDTPMTFQLKLPAETPNSETLSFEPMHLVDYFASQGIKLSEEEPKDKLGKQLKSFTEWLKTMKKLPAQDSSQSLSPAEQPDLTVQALAEKSNQEQEVVTEAMAEVLASQGKRGKAAELYQKLSLMNPSKSAYFAAKIEQLKDT